jgi:hypothetical protein
MWTTIAYYCWCMMYWIAGTSAAKGLVINLSRAMAERTDNTLDDLLVAKLEHHLDDNGETIISDKDYMFHGESEASEHSQNEA